MTSIIQLSSCNVSAVYNITGHLSSALSCRRLSDLSTKSLCTHQKSAHQTLSSFHHFSGRKEKICTWTRQCENKWSEDSKLNIVRADVRLSGSNPSRRTSRVAATKGPLLWSSVIDSREAKSAPSESKGDRYTFYVDGGGEITAGLHKDAGGSSVITIQAGGPLPRALRENPVYLHWGIFRSDRDTWVKVDEASVPAGTIFLSGKMEAMRTPLNVIDNGKLETVLRFPRGFDLFAVNFVLYQPPARETDQEHWFRSTRDKNFCIPVGMERGRPDNLGATWGKDGSVNFALYAKHAQGVTLCLYNAEDAEPTLEIDLEPALHRTGDVWHIKLPEQGEYTRYGYRCKGEVTWENGCRFHARQILLDPYAKTVAPPVPGQEEWPSPAAALGLLAPDDPTFDWGDDYPLDIPIEELVAYRINVGGFTADPTSGVAEEARGTFLGVAQKADYLASLGVNAVILQPVFACDENQGTYFPISFFALNAAYGPQNDAVLASQAMKVMVRELHQRGIEVVLEVVYSHTAEQSDDNPKTVSFRGIDNATYYVNDMFGQQLVPDFGPSNQFNCNQPAVQSLVVDSLRHWVEQYHVDGFSFVNAQALVTGPHGQELSRPLLVEAITFDPVLGRAKLIADFTSPINGIHKPLTFPNWGRWQEFNRRFRDDVRRFARGEPGQLSSLATRFFGSGDMYDDGRGPSHSLNYVTSPLGLSLADLVSYSNDEEFSWSCGSEGPTDDFLVISTRMRQVRNFLVSLFICQGVPVLTMGDEYGHSKDGGSFSLDNSEGGAFRWDALAHDYGQQLTRLIPALASFRQRRSSLLQRKAYMAPQRVSWHGFAPGEPQWDNPESSFLAVGVHTVQTAPAPPEVSAEGEAAADKPAPRAMVVQEEVNSAESDFGDLYVAFNAHHYPVSISLPKPPFGMTWYRVADTNLGAPNEFDVGGTELLPPPPGEGMDPDFNNNCVYDMQSYSILVFEARVTKGPDGKPLYLAKDEPEVAPEPVSASTGQQYNF